MDSFGDGVRGADNAQRGDDEDFLMHNVDPRRTRRSVSASRRLWKNPPRNEEHCLILIHKDCEPQDAMDASQLAQFGLEIMGVEPQKKSLVRNHKFRGCPWTIKI